jgi:hypothetical protein
MGNALHEMREHYILISELCTPRNESRTFRDLVS